MGWLVPNTFDLRDIIDESERKTVATLIKTLSDEWIVIPQVRVIHKGENSEIDILLVSRHMGVFVLEVKGGLISRRDGQWYSYSKKIKDPFAQATRAKHQLVKRFETLKFDLTDFFMNEVAVFPDAGEIPADGMGISAPRSRIFNGEDLKDPETAMARIRRPNRQVSVERFKAFVHAICPTVHLSFDGGELHQSVLHRLDDATRTRLGALVGLADNPRFLAIGAAGTGKTFLAERWARRCASRGERTLFVCYNVPLGDDLAERLEDSDVVVGSFHEYVLSLLEPLGIKAPDNPGPHWWEVEVPQMLVDNAHAIPERFDAIVIDEGQDFRPEWLDALKTLMRNDGPRRLLMVADPRQAIYAGPWSMPEGIPSIELEFNVRSTLSVGRHVADLGGADPDHAAMEGPPVRHVQTTPESVVDVIGAELSRVLEEYSLPLAHVAVLTSHRALRDTLIASKLPVKLARWDERDEDVVVCETVHRAKGLERLAIISVDLDEDRVHELDYIGSSRAVLHLTVITR